MTADLTNSSIDSLLSLFSGIVDKDDDLPKAYVLYRESRSAYLNGDVKRANAIKRLIKILHSSEIPFTAENGKNSLFAYGGIGVIIHGAAKIGERCNIGSNVTIGGSWQGSPVIGHDVYIATGAKIIGNVVISDGAIVGANAVVLTSIPAFTVFAGIPARSIGQVDRDAFDRYSAYYWCKGNPEAQEKFLNWYFPPR